MQKRLEKETIGSRYRILKRSGNGANYNVNDNWPNVLSLDGTNFEFNGLSTECIDYHQPNSDARRKAYNADITYGTNNEFGFDYLRDNMASSKDDLVQRAPN